MAWSMVFLLDGCSFYYVTYGVNQEFRFDEGIWLHQKRKYPFYIKRAQRVLSNHLSMKRMAWRADVEREKKKSPLCIR